MPVSHMIQSGERYALGDNPEHPMFPGVELVESAMESLTFAFHGGVFTHIDGLAHVFFKAQMYNGRPLQAHQDLRGGDGPELRRDARRHPLERHPLRHPADARRRRHSSPAPP